MHASTPPRRVPPDASMRMPEAMAYVLEQAAAQGYHSGRAVAHALGVSPNTITRIQQGKRQPGLRVRHRIKQVFGIDLNALVPPT